MYNYVFGQLSLSVVTDKQSYTSGEQIIIKCIVKNNTDTTITIISQNMSSCQAEFSFNDFNSYDWTYCFPAQEQLVFPPKSYRTYTWKLDPRVYGFPNKNGKHRIIGYYFNNLRDTTYIESERYLGGQLRVNFSTTNELSIIILKDSLKAIPFYRSISNGNVTEYWQIEGLVLDSVHTKLVKDSRFNWVLYKWWTQYYSVILTSVEKEYGTENYVFSDSYPNPFNGISRFYVEVPKSESINISLYNILGEKIFTIYSGVLVKNSRYHFEINGENMASGIYFYVIRSVGFNKSKKLILLK